MAESKVVNQEADQAHREVDLDRKVVLGLAVGLDHEVDLGLEVAQDLEVVQDLGVVQGLEVVLDHVVNQGMPCIYFTFIGTEFTTVSNSVAMI